MVTALTATPDTTAGTVLLNITGAPAGAVVLTRTDANGSNPVRQRTGQVTSGGALVLTDYEAALVGGVTYDAVDSAGVRKTATTTLERPGGYAERFASVQLPAQAHTASLVLGYEAQRSSSTTIHDILGRVDPVAVVGTTQLRRGTLEVFSMTYAEARHAADTASAALLMYRQSDYPGMDMWLTVTGVRVRALETPAEAGWRWSTALDYVEVRPPAVPLLGAAGWTFNGVTGRHTTFAAVRGSYATFADLLVGP